MSQQVHGPEPKPDEVSIIATLALVAQGLEGALAAVQKVMADLEHEVTRAEGAHPR